MINHGNKYDNFIRKNYLKLSCNKMAEIKGISKTFFLRRRNKLGLIVPKEITSKWKNGQPRDKSFDKVIRELYLQFPVKTLATKIGKSGTFVNTAIRAMGLVIPEELIERRIKDSRYPTGHEPANKGRKFPGKINATCFKKGNIAPNKLHFRDRMITLRYDKKAKRPYWWVRISLRVWKMYHVEIWERENGPVPPGHIVVFKDKNSMNCVVENLEMITLEENMRRNTIHRYPEELKQSIKLVHKLNRKIEQYAKQN